MITTLRTLRLTPTLLLGFALLVVMVLAAFWLVDRQTQTFALVRHTLEVENRLSELLSQLQDTETGQRGFLLTGRPEYLEPYNAALARISTDLAELTRVTADNPDQQRVIERLRGLANARQDVLRETIILYRNGDAQAATAPERLDRGKGLMDEIRSVVTGMKRTAQTTLQDREAALASQVTMAKAGLVLLAVIIIALAAFTISDARRRLRALMTSSEALAASNVRLEEEARTRQAAEAQLRQMQKMESIGQLTGGIAHDFNNMLSIVIGSLDIARRRLGSDPQRVESCIENAMDGARRAAQLTSRLLAFSRQQPLEPRALDANKLVGGMSELLRRTIGENLRIETVLAGGLWRALIDASQLESAILNLAVNARDAMPDGGKLTIETSNAHLDESYAAAHTEVEAGQYVLVSITDTGTGMPAEVIERAFDPFFTTKGVGRGTGLGLSQVHGFVKQSGGHVKIYSEPGQGTTVKLYLPRYYGQEPAAEERLAAGAQTELVRAKDNEVILVVEDEESVRHLSIDTLRELGYTVVHAADASQALAVLSLQPRVDLLFTDIMMPDMNGRRLADQARQIRPDLKVLYTTGYTRNAVVHNGMLDVGVAFLAKPFTLDQLATKVRQVLDGGGINRPFA